MVYDCVPFFNELDILKLRMHIMAPYVDKFVIEESTVTFSGEPKPMIFAENRELFAEFEDKILYVAVDNSPMSGVTTHERDKFQKNQLIKALGDCKADDIIIFSDVDEIPNPKVLTDVIAHFDASKIYHFAQRMFYCFLNMEEVSGNLLSITGEFPGVVKRQWLGTKVCSFGNLPKEGIVFLREVSPTDPASVRVADGGWHFGYMGGNGERDVAKRIGVKVKAAAHQEYNSKRYLSEAVDRLLCGEDIFDRDAKFVRVEIDESFPAYLRMHREEYGFLIAPEVSKAEIAWKKAKLGCMQFLRKIHGAMARLMCLCVIIIGLAAVLVLFVKTGKDDRAAGNREPENEIVQEVQDSEQEQREDEAAHAEEPRQPEIMRTGAWKTEECYGYTESGETYLRSLTEYNSHEDVTRTITYDVDGSVKREREYENEYYQNGMLAKKTEFCGDELLGWDSYEYDDEGRITCRSSYNKDGCLTSKMPYSYEYDKDTRILRSHHMAFSYDENGEYRGSGPSTYATSEYDEENRMTAYYSYPVAARCYMYDKTEEQIIQSLQEITLESENPVYQSIAEMFDEYGEDISIEVYQYDRDGNLQAIDAYNAVTGVLDRKTTCTYEYDDEGRIREGSIENEKEIVYVTYCYDGKDSR